MKPWPEDFDNWFNSEFKFYFGTKWLIPIARKFALAGWCAALTDRG